MSIEDPVVCHEVLNLTNYGCPPDEIRFGQLTIESDKFLCCKSTDNEKNILNIFEITGISTEEPVTLKPEKFPMNGDSAIMNPVKKWLAIRGGVNLQVFDTLKKEKVCSHKMDADVKIAYWTWLTEDVIGLVSQTTVYHWDVVKKTVEVAFERHSTLEGSQILSYKSSSDLKWLLITGLSKGTTPGVAVGNMQLYSVAKQVSQTLTSHAGAFANITKENETVSRNVIAFIEKKDNAPARIFIMEVGREKDDPNGVFKLPPQVLNYPTSATNSLADFPVSMIYSEKQELIYVITKQGFVFLFDIFTGKNLFCKKLLNETVFASTYDSTTGGVLGVTNKKGQILHLTVNNKSFVPYLLSRNEGALALKLAGKLNLKGADHLYLTQFQKMLNDQAYTDAVRVAATSPNDILRTTDTINILKEAQSRNPSSGNLLLQYFKKILEKSSLNEIESFEITKMILEQNKVSTLENLLKERKLFMTEHLGDLIFTVAEAEAPGSETRTQLLKCALSVYFKSNSHAKVVECFVHLNQLEKVASYCKQVNFEADFTVIVQDLIRKNPKGALTLAKQLASAEGGPKIDVALTVDIFLQYNCTEEATSFLIEYLKPDSPKDAALQTKLIELNILNKKDSVVEAIFSNNMFHHYDKDYIATLLEKFGHYRRALQHYSDIVAVKRVLVKYMNVLYMDTDSAGKNKDERITMEEEALINYFSTFESSELQDCLEYLLKSFQGSLNVHFLRLMVGICSRYSAELEPEKVINMFEKYDISEGVFLYVSSVINSTNSSAVVFKYIENGCKLGRYDMVVSVIKENKQLPEISEKLKDYLILENLKDPRPLIHLCDRFGFISELTAYLVNKDLIKALEIYVEKVNPAQAGKVIAKLIDLDCPEALVEQMLGFETVRKQVNYNELIDILDQRNKLYLMKGMLEHQVTDGKSTDVSMHNALAKLRILTNQSAETFLKTDSYYDHLLIGKFCERLDSHLAFVSYSSGGGKCDDELVFLCLKNRLFKELSTYCFERQDALLWGKVLGQFDVPHSAGKENESKKTVQRLKTEKSDRTAFVDAILANVIPASSDTGAVTVCLKAFMSANLSFELIRILEQLLLQKGTTFKSTSLQNLLLVTAVKNYPENVSKYIDQLDNFDANSIAQLCLNQDTPLLSEAFQIYTKNKMYTEAMEVLCSTRGDVTEAKEFADKLLNESDDDPSEAKSRNKEVCAVLSKFLLSRGLLSEAIEYLLVSENSEMYQMVIEGVLSKETNADEIYRKLIEYLTMVRTVVKEKEVDTSIALCFSKLNDRTGLDVFLQKPNIADVAIVADKISSILLKEPRIDKRGLQLLEICVTLYDHGSNHTMLARCYVKMKDYKHAIEAAKKANNSDIWKHLNMECLNNKEYDYAKTVGLFLLQNPINIEEVVQIYESKGLYSELLTLVEECVNNGTTHHAIYTHLAVLYVKYLAFISTKKTVDYSKKLLNFLNSYASRLNISTVVNSMRQMAMYSEVCTLYSICGDVEQALGTMVAYKEICFSHERVIEILARLNTLNNAQPIKVREDTCLKLINLYYEYAPSKLSDFLIELHTSVKGEKVIDIKGVVDVVASSELFILKDFLCSVVDRESRMKMESAARRNKNMMKYDKQKSLGSELDVTFATTILNKILILEHSYETLESTLNAAAAPGKANEIQLIDEMNKGKNNDFKLLSVEIYIRNGKYEQAVKLCNNEKEYESSIKCAYLSHNGSLCNSLLETFIEQNLKELFVAALTICHSYVSADIVLELCWLKAWTDLMTPFMVGYIKASNNRITALETALGAQGQKKKENGSAELGISGRLMLDNS